MACHQRTVFLRKEFTKLRLLPLPTDKGIHVDSVPKLVSIFWAQAVHVGDFVPEDRNVSLAPKRHFVNNLILQRYVLGQRQRVMAFGSIPNSA